MVIGSQQAFRNALRAGKGEKESVYSLARQLYPEADGPMIVHRLDMATSGLLILAKNKKVHQHLQAQFKNHSIRKKYIALLDGIIPQDEGTIELPICPDPLDRPRQVVDMEYGKPAITHYQVLERRDKCTRIAFIRIQGALISSVCMPHIRQVCIVPS